MATPPNPDEKDPLGMLFDKTFQPYIDSFIEYFNTNFDPDAITTILAEVDASASRVINTFGVGRERIVELKSSMADAVASVAELGGEFSNIEQIQTSISETLKRNVILTSDAFQELYAITQVTGKDAGALVSTFKDVGVSVYQMGERVNEALAVSQKLGVNAKEVIGSMMNNMDALNKFNFEGGTEGMARMAAHAASLRFNMKETLNLADKVFNPEGAIQVAAAMQRLGVAQSDLLDPLRLMDLAQNDPEELQKQLEGLSKSFVKMKADGSFEILPGEKRRLMEIESQLGMTQGSLAKLALSSSEVGEKMKKIRFGGDFSEEEQRFIASITEIGKGGDMTIQLGGEKLGINEALAELKKDPEKLEKMMKPKDAIQLAKDQLNTLDSIDASMKVVAGKTGYAMAGTRGISEYEEAQRKVAGLVPRMEEAPGVKTEDIRKDFFGVFDRAIDDMVAGKSKQDVFANLDKGLKDYSAKLANFPVHATKVITSLDTSSNRFLILGDKVIGLTDAIKEAGIPDLSKSIENMINSSATPGGGTKVKVKDFILETLPEDTLEIVEGKLVGGTNLGRGGSSKVELELTQKIVVDTSKSPNLDSAAVEKIVRESMSKDEMRKLLKESVDKAVNNNGRSGQGGNDPLKSNLAPVGRK